MAIGLWNSTFTLAERGFYGMAYALSLFAATAVQKNVRDLRVIGDLEDEAKRLDPQTPWCKRNVSLFVRDDVSEASKEEPKDKPENEL